MKKIFKAKEGASFGEDKAQIYGEELEKLQKINDGKLTPKYVVEVAKDKSSPIHDFFEWDNNKASEKWRLHQARQLLNSIEIVITYNGKKEEIRRYFNITKVEEDNDDTKRVYIIMEEALSNPKYKKQILQRALEEIEYWQKKYSQYKELSMIFKSIEKTKQRIKC